MNSAVAASDQLYESIQAILETLESPLSEYELIQLLNQQGWDLPTQSADSLATFQTHFLVFNVLYRLQENYWQEQRWLNISALSIELSHPLGKTDERSVADYQGDEALREYYLDLDKLEEATTESVEALLQQFWQRFVSSDDVTKALEVFELSPPLDSRKLKQRYRSLAMTHHPDRGGEEEDFQRIQWAFGVLQRYIN